MSKLAISYVAPEELQPNPWNPNKVDPVNQEKIAESLKSETFFRPILARELDDGTLQIIGGEHRTKAAISLGMKSVPVINLGSMCEGEAKRKTLLDNGRYGDNDNDLLVSMLSDAAMGSAEDLLSILPIDEAELAGLFDSVELDLDELDLDDDLDDSIDLDIPTSSVKQSQMMRFKVSVEDAVAISDLITRIKHEQGFTESDDLTNAGDSLVWLANAFLETKHA